MQPSNFSSQEDGLHQEQDQFRKFTDKSQNEIPTDIQRFYSGASVLVTGATGFMGKVMIEKLLRSCPDIDSIYMIVREKKGRSLEERIDDVISSPCFDRIKRERPDFRSHLRAVAGDIGLEGLGLSEEDRHSLQQQVNIIFHMAATVRFDEHLKVAILYNVRATREVLDLSRTCKNLRAVVHVSTAYSNCPETQIDERFYDPLWPSDHMIHLAESHDVTTLDRLLHKLIGKWPNTYSFTKALSEDVVRNHGRGLPVVVFRPSVVMPTKCEPMHGWTDTFYGPTGVIVGTAVGILRTMQTNENAVANLVPCDMAINALIASAWDVAENRDTTDTPIYNYVATSDNEITWKQLTDFTSSQTDVLQLSAAVWTANILYLKNRTNYLVYRVFVHILPALLVDIFLLATNRSPKLIKAYQKFHRYLEVISYFTTREWHFENKRVQRMWKNMHNNDKEFFFFDMDSLSWYDFVKKSSYGLRVHLLKDPMETLPAAKEKLQKLTVLNFMLKCVLALFVIWLSGHVLPPLWTALRAVVEGTISYCILSPIQRLITFSY